MVEYNLHRTPIGVLVGDSLFAGSIGRTDFPGSDFETLAQSIREKLYTLPDDMRVLPGHGLETSVGKERTSNPFVQYRPYEKTSDTRQIIKT